MQRLRFPPGPTHAARIKTRKVNFNVCIINVYYFKLIYHLT
jgi:hypothetical protein